MDDGDLLGFDEAHNGAATDPSTANQSNGTYSDDIPKVPQHAIASEDNGVWDGTPQDPPYRDSGGDTFISTDDDVPAFARPPSQEEPEDGEEQGASTPQLDQQEPVNLLNFGGTEPNNLIDSTPGSKNLLDLDGPTANDSAADVDLFSAPPRTERATHEVDADLLGTNTVSSTPATDGSSEVVDLFETAAPQATTPSNTMNSNTSMLLNSNVTDDPFAIPTAPQPGPFASEEVTVVSAPAITGGDAFAGIGFPTAASTASASNKRQASAPNLALPSETSASSRGTAKASSVPDVVNMKDSSEGEELAEPAAADEPVNDPVETNLGEKSVDYAVAGTPTGGSNEALPFNTKMPAELTVETDTAETITPLADEPDSERQFHEPDKAASSSQIQEDELTLGSALRVEDDLGAGEEEQGSRRSDHGHAAEDISLPEKGSAETACVSEPQAVAVNKDSGVTIRQSEAADENFGEKQVANDATTLSPKGPKVTITSDSAEPEAESSSPRDGNENESRLASKEEEATKSEQPQFPASTNTAARNTPHVGMTESKDATSKSPNTNATAVSPPMSPTVVSVAEPSAKPAESTTTGAAMDENESFSQKGEGQSSATIVQLPDLPSSQAGDEKHDTADTAHESGEQFSGVKQAGDISSESQPNDATKSTPPLDEPSKLVEASAHDRVLMERIQKLEQELSDTQSTIQQMQEQKAKDDENAKEKDSILSELQSNLQTQMGQRAEAEDKARRAETAAKTFKEKLQTLRTESKTTIEKLEESLADVTKKKSDMETEVEALQEERDEKARKEASMALRLNSARKTESEDTNTAEYYEEQSDYYKKELESTKEEFAEVTQERDQLKEEVTQWKEYADKRTKQLEKALSKEKELNDERKRKMREFIETKTEEVRTAKADFLGLQTEMDQTNMTLKDLNQRYKQLHSQWVESQTRNRELQRDITKMQKDSEKMSKVGGTLEAKLSWSAMESEDHKNKRLAAKNELMAVLRQLEAERYVNNRLRERIKTDFTPKALSQQQSLQELLDELESALTKVAPKLGRALPPPPVAGNDLTMGASNDQTTDALVESSDSSAATISEVNTQRVLTKLENEIKRVTQCIYNVNSSVQRLQSLVAQPSNRSCVDAFSALLMASQADESTAMTGNNNGVRR